MKKIPVREVTLADAEAGTAVIGVVDREAIPAVDEPDTRTDTDDPTSIPPGGELISEVPIEVGDLLTSSSKPGHAKKATDPKIGTILGKALEPLPEGTGYIAVFVNIQ